MCTAGDVLATVNNLIWRCWLLTQLERVMVRHELFKMAAVWASY